MNNDRYIETLKQLQKYSDGRNLTILFENNYVPKKYYEVTKIVENLSRESLNTINSESELNALQLNRRKIALRTLMTVNNTLTAHHYHMSSWSKGVYKALLSNNYQPETKRLADFAYVLLRLAWNISGKDKIELSNAEILELLGLVVTRLSNSHRQCEFVNRVSIPIGMTDVNSKWFFMKGEELLCVPCLEDDITYCIWLKTCKRFFKSALGVQDEYNESIQLLSNAYLSALYCVSEESQARAEEHFTRALHNLHLEGTTQDDVIIMSLETILNLINSKTNHPARSSIISNFKRISSMQPSSASNMFVFAVSSHKRGLSNSQDTGASALCESHEEPNMIQPLATNKLKEILLRLSIEYFTNFLQLETELLRGTGIDVGWNITSIYEALYRYKLEEYTTVLQLCNSMIPAEVLQPNADMNLISINHTWYRDISVSYGFQLLFRGGKVSSLFGLIAIADHVVKRNVLKPETKRDAINEYRKRLFGRVGGKDKVRHIDDYYRILYDRKHNQFNSDDFQEFKNKENKKIDEEVNSLDMQYSFTTLSPEFLVCFLRFESLRKLKRRRSDLVHALKIMNLAKKGLPFEKLLCLISAREIEIVRKRNQVR